MDALSVSMLAVLTGFAPDVGSSNFSVGLVSAVALVSVGALLPLLVVIAVVCSGLS